jgi:endonuclease/exonuclease/phosphatase family metal-dependent hydrolase
MKKVFLFATCVFVYQVCAGQPVQETSPQKLKLLSWNIYMLPGVITNLNGRRAEAIGKLLAASDYDIVVFQEAFCPLARMKLRRLLATRFPYQAGPANRKLFSVKTNSGLWIFSAYPILSHQSIIFKNRQGMDALSRKGALLVEIDVNGRRVQIAATHLQNSGNAWLRHAQCVEFYERLLKPTEKEGTPQIICGDFNISKNSSLASYHFMLTTLDASDGDLTGDNKFTYDRLRNDLHVEKGTGRDLIDYILVRENGAWIDHSIRQIKAIKNRWHIRHEDLSDHYALEAEIHFTNFPSVISAR